jgi:hypothetical protein
LGHKGIWCQIYQACFLDGTIVAYQIKSFHTVTRIPCYLGNELTSFVEGCIEDGMARSVNRGAMPGPMGLIRQKKQAHPK